MDRPEFSFVIPARNEGPVLLDTLFHIRSLGDEEQVEIIVVDDASLSPVSHRDDLPSLGIKHVRFETRQGVAKARNRGASEAIGSTLIFADSHVCFSSGLLDDLREIDVTGGRGIYGCATTIVGSHHDFQEIVANGAGAGLATYYGWRIALEPSLHVQPILGEGISTEKWFAVPYVGACSLALSRELFHRMGGFDEGLVGFGCNEDLDLAMRCWGAGLSVMVNPRATCWHLTEPRTNPDRTNNNPFEHLDLPRYSGSFLNTIRVLYLHFPNDIFRRIAETHGMDRELWSILTSSEVQNRKAWLQTQRVISQHELFDRMTAGLGGMRV